MIARRPSWRSPPLLRHPASRQKTPFTPSFLADKKSIAVAIVGGIREVEGIANSAKIEQLARFAVDERNKKETALLEFLVRVVKAKERVVAGALHQLTVEAVDAGKKKVDEAKVWVKPWLNFKELQEFRHAADSGLRIMVLGKVRRCCETTCCLRVGIYHMSSKYYDVCKTTSRHFFMYRR
nr:PREDICTED: LOW QUALITY PROTEIN: cysteine proteinase inhibitor-like [Musa acuminata subsp. malaccensis]